MTAPTAAEVGESDRKTIVARVADELEALSRVLGSNRAPLVRNGVEVIRTLESQLLAARREVEALRAAATDCADDLEAELRNRYHYPDVHPAMQGKYERDMESVLAVRAALAATSEEK